jgi:hypothetical protein
LARDGNGLSLYLKVQLCRTERLAIRNCDPLVFTPGENTAQGEYILSKNAKVVMGALAGICVVIAVVILLISYQRRNVVEIKRQGDGNATLAAHLSNPCGDVPNNIKSANSSAFEAALSKAIKNSDGKDLDAHVKAELASTLDQIPASSQTANDLVALQVTACRACLADGLSAEACVKLGSDVRQEYVDLKKKNSR